LVGYKSLLHYCLLQLRHHVANHTKITAALPSHVAIITQNTDSYLVFEAVIVMPGYCNLYSWYEFYSHCVVSVCNEILQKTIHVNITVCVMNIIINVDVMSPMININLTL